MVSKLIFVPPHLDHQSFYPYFPKNKDIYLIIDDKIPFLYPEFYQQLLEIPRLMALPYHFKASEENKSWEEYLTCCHYFLKHKIHPKSEIIVIGGGTTSDLAGFVASTLLRGISWHVIPTTLLSMVDASIGGKVGINTPYGKNLIGQYHYPETIILSPSFLKTLNQDEIDSGKGEILKSAFLDHKIFHKILQNKNDEDLSLLIYECAQFKLGFTAKNPQDALISSDRKFLNLGHTFGHVLEKSKDNLPHGVAVIQGIFLIIQYFSSQNQSDSDALYSKLIIIMDQLGIPLSYLNFSLPDKDKFLFYLESDKKRVSTYQIELILPEISYKTRRQKITIPNIMNNLFPKTIKKRC